MANSFGVPVPCVIAVAKDFWAASKGHRADPGWGPWRAEYLPWGLRSYTHHYDVRTSHKRSILNAGLHILPVGAHEKPLSKGVMVCSGQPPHKPEHICHNKPPLRCDRL